MENKIQMEGSQILNDSDDQGFEIQPESDIALQELTDVLLSPITIEKEYYLKQIITILNNKFLVVTKEIYFDSD